MMTPRHTAIFTKDILACIERLKSGKLVAIPTETVYGLAADAWNERALECIFAAKERPKDDPLIVHVKDFTTGLEFWNAEYCDTMLLKKLADAFWPGPLTMVATAKDTVPSIVTAGTGMVAVRSPAIDPRLLAIPLAAPSANKFGHVSPTTAQHVYDDLKEEDIWILESSDDDICRIGVESTVISVSNQVITMLRHGHITKEQLSAVTGIPVHEKNQSIGAPHVAPGQTIQHYSPRLPSFLIEKGCISDPNVLRNAVVLDIYDILSDWKDESAYYRSLGDSDTEIAQNLFGSLRWAEDQANAQCVLFPKITHASGILEAVADRLHRAASGNVVTDLKSIDTTTK